MRHKKVGPFSYFSFKKGKNRFISVWLTGHDEMSFGWEWGSDGYGNFLPLHIRLFGLDIFAWNYSIKNLDIRFLGFWFIR